MASVGASLRALGLAVDPALDQRDGYDCLVNGQVRVATRFALPTKAREQTYRKKNGEVSSYRYRRWTFNFHRQGKLPPRYCDFFVCLLVASLPRAERPSRVTPYVIPWEAITGLTFCSSVRLEAQGAYRGRYSRYQDAWPGLVEAAQADGSVTRRQSSVPPLQLHFDESHRFGLSVGAQARR